MGRRSDLFLLFLFLLSLLFLPLTTAWNKYQKQIDDRRFVDESQDRASALVQQFNANCTVRSHLRQGIIRAQNQLGRLSQPFADQGEILKNALFNNIPAKLLPADATVYLFKFSQNRAKSFLGKGLERQNSVFLARIVEQLKDWQQISPAERTRVDNRLANIFGSRVGGDLLLSNRRGRLIEVVFNQQSRTLFWDFLRISGEIKAAFIILLPSRPTTTGAAVESLFELVKASSSRFYPVLLPIESLQEKIKPVVPQFWRSENPVLCFFSELSKKGNYDKVASFSAGTLFNQTFVFRAATLKHLPFELWLTTEKAGARQNKESVVFLLLLAVLWIVIFSLRVYRRRPFAISVKSRMFVLIMVVGGLPIVILLLAGLSVIAQDHHQRKRLMVEGLRAELKEIDGNSTSLRMIFEEVARKYLDDSEFRNTLLAKVVDEDSSVFLRCFSDFDNAGVPLEAIGIINFGKPDKMLFSPEYKKERDLSKLNFFSPMMYAGLKDFSQQAYKNAMNSLSESQRLGYETYQAITSTSLFRDLSQARQKSFVMSLGDSGHFILFDFIADKDKVVGAVVFFAPAAMAYSRYAKAAIMRGARFSPDRLWAMAENRGDEITLTIPRSQAKSHGQRKFLRNLLEARKTSSLQIDDQQEILQVAIPCENMRDIALSSNLAVNSLHLKTAANYRLLYAASLLLTVILLLVASGLASFFFWPLKTIEDGIAGILKRKFDFRIDLGRDDELGDVANAFDEMAQGLCERHELSLFVSGALTRNLDVDEKDFLQTGNEKLWGAVLASDIRNFTTLSEIHSPEEIVKMLNQHLELMSEEILRQNGQIDKFIGDAIVAAFFAETKAAACEKAVNAGLKMMERHRLFNLEREQRGQFGYGMGVGIACGELLVGSFGAAERHECCLMGMPRHQSEELEAESKKGRFTHVVISAEIKDLLPELNAARLADSDNFEVIEA